MTEPRRSIRQRPHHGLFLGEGILVLGAAIFLIGFAIEKSSNTPGRALEATGIVIFAVGLFVAAAFGHLLSRHFARTSSDPLAPVTLEPLTEPPSGLENSGGRLHPAVSDAAAPLAQEVEANPENDAAASRLIERERRGAEDGE